MTTTYLTVNGRYYGPLTPREEEIYNAGQWVGMAHLRTEVVALGVGPNFSAYGVGYDGAIRDVLELIDGTSKSTPSYAKTGSNE